MLLSQLSKKNPCSLFRASYRLILTWRHQSCHDVDERVALTLGTQHKYLPVEWLGWCMRYMLMVVQMLQNKLMYIFIERGMAQWLERDALTMLLPAVRFRIRLLAGFSEKNHVSPLSILGHCFDVVSLGKALHPQMLHLTQVKMRTR